MMFSTGILFHNDFHMNEAFAAFANGSWVNLPGQTVDLAGSLHGERERNPAVARLESRIFEAPRERFGKFGFEMHETIATFECENTAAGVNQGKMTAVGNWNAQLHMHERIDGHHGIDARQKIVEPAPVTAEVKILCDDSAVGIYQRGQILGARAVDFVEDVNARAVLHAKIGRELSALRHPARRDADWKCR